MNKEDAEKYLRLLGQELQKQDVMGEILVHDDIYVFIDIKIPEIVDINAYLTDAGDELETIAAYFGSNGAILHQTIQRIADDKHLSMIWWQSSINIIFLEQQNKWIEYPGIRIYAPQLGYVFTMKIIASDEQYQEMAMVRLAEALKINDTKTALSIIKRYIPSKLISAKIRTRIKQCVDFLGKEQKAEILG